MFRPFWTVFFFDYQGSAVQSVSFFSKEEEYKTSVVYFIWTVAVFVLQVKEVAGGIAFTEFKMMMDGYKKGHSDYSVAAVSRRIKVLFRGAK